VDRLRKTTKTVGHGNRNLDTVLNPVHKNTMKYPAKKNDTSESKNIRVPVHN